MNLRSRFFFLRLVWWKCFYILARRVLGSFTQSYLKLVLQACLCTLCFFLCTFCTVNFSISFSCCGYHVLGFTPITCSYVLYIRVFRAGVETSKHINGDFILCNIWCTSCVGEFSVRMCTLPSKWNSRCFPFCKYAAVLQPFATFSAGHSCMACAVSVHRLCMARKIN